MTNLQERWSASLMNTYGTPELAVVRGEGAWLYDAHGRRFLDFLAGIAVSALGHCHPSVQAAIREQAATLDHVSNLYVSEPAIRAAELLRARFSDGNEAVARETKVFFCNSGGEANEAAFKLARLTGRGRVLAAERGFHGRTMGSLALTGQPGKRAPFEPMPEGVEFYPYGNLEALERLVDESPDDVAAIFLEPIQGETGVIPAPDDFLAGVRQLCDRVGALMVVDEVQTGVGRTGDFFAFQHEAGVLPDVVTMAKALGGGVPLGACLAHGTAAELFTPGAHGTTFGGNPIACAAATAVLEAVDNEMLAHVRATGAELAARLSTCPGVREVRGRGLMLGVVLDGGYAKQVVSAGLAHGLIVNAPADDVVRLTPPLIIGEGELALGVEKLRASLDAARKGGA